MGEELQHEKLVKKAMRGDADAYGKVIEMNKEYLYKMAFMYVKNREDALDVVGTTILKGFQAIHSLRSPLLFKTWITRILLNTAVDVTKKIIPYREIGEMELPSAENETSIEESADLKDAIEKLPEKYRTVILLKYYSGMTVEEIAFAMGIPQGSVKSYLSRARSELKKELKEDYRYAN